MNIMIRRVVACRARDETLMLTRCILQNKNWKSSGNHRRMKKSAIVTWIRLKYIETLLRIRSKLILKDVYPYPESEQYL